MSENSPDRYQPFIAKPMKRIMNEESHQLYKNILVPSAMNQYSIAIQYMRDWFVSKFPTNYLKNVYIDSKHILDDFRNANGNGKKKDLVKLMRPMLAITPKINLEYNRDNVDLVNIGRPKAPLFGRYKDQAFFRDYERNLFILAVPEELEMQFDFKIKVSTKALQIDLYKRMQIMYPVQGSTTPYIDFDVHIPYELIKAIAIDIDAELDDKGNLVDPLYMISYLNSHSSFVFLNKFRPINGREEFFLRFTNAPMYIKIGDALSADDGEREGMLYTNYMIEMSTYVKFPSIKYFMYYSATNHEYVVNSEEPSEFLGMMTIAMIDVPDTNSKGWNKYVTMDYMADKVDEPLSINFTNQWANNDIYDIIMYTKDKRLVNPEIFLDVHLYNNESEVPVQMDWDKLELTTLEPITAYKSHIVVYGDYTYINEVISNIKNMTSNRVKNSGT